jgi:hypothetical protein
VKFDVVLTKEGVELGALKLKGFKVPLAPSLSQAPFRGRRVTLRVSQ